MALNSLLHGPYFESRRVRETSATRPLGRLRRDTASGSQRKTKP